MMQHAILLLKKAQCFEFYFKIPARAHWKNVKMHRLTLFIKKQMNSNHLLLATLALFLADFLEHVQSSPTLSSVDSFDDVDMSLLRRAMRQGNDCDSQVAYTGKKHLVSFKMMLTNGSSIYLIIFFYRKKFGNFASVARKWLVQQWRILSAVSHERILESGVWSSWPSGSANNLDTQSRNSLQFRHLSIS